MFANSCEFSDEFNLDGRTFYSGDDPYWTAVDLWYGVTGDLEVRFFFAMHCRANDEVVRSGRHLDPKRHLEHSF
jgi:hypothetical protein